MDLTFDPRLPVKETVGSSELARSWALGPDGGDDDSPVGQGPRRYSFWAECECPDLCLRDHENE